MAIHYDQITEGKYNVDMFGHINIIAGYPRIGKGQAHRELHMDECFQVYNLSADTVQNKPGATEDNWVNLYVQLVKTTISDISMNIAFAGEDDHTTYLIFVSAHPEIRKALAEQDIPVIYIRPTPTVENMQQFIKYFNHKTNCDLYSFNGGSRTFVTEEVVRLEANGPEPELELTNEAVIYVDANPNAASGSELFPSLTNMIYAMTTIPFEYRNANTVPNWATGEFQDKMARTVTDMLVTKHYGKLGMAYYRAADVAKTLAKIITKKYTIGLTSKGIPYIVFGSADEKALRMQRRFVRKKHIPEPVAERMANLGTDFIVMPRDDAQNILDMLTNAILRLESGTRDDNDIEVFGEKAISYERLVDEIDHSSIAYSVMLEDQRKGKADGNKGKGLSKKDYCTVTAPDEDVEDEDDD